MENKSLVKFAAEYSVLVIKLEYLNYHIYNSKSKKKVLKQMEYLLESLAEMKRLLEVGIEFDTDYINQNYRVFIGK